MAWAMLILIPVVFAEIPLLLWVTVPVIFGIGVHTLFWGLVVELH